MKGDKMKIGFIGAGKVGFSLGKYFSENNIDISGFYSRNYESAKEAADFTGSFPYDNTSDLINDSDAIFITVPDGQIKKVFEELPADSLTGKMICHCSGAMTAEEAFPDISDDNAYGFSIHPLFPISSKYESYKELKNAFFCLEGSLEKIDLWSELLSGMGNNVKVISDSNKVQYHAACAIASNLVCALIDESASLMENCGFTYGESLKALSPLVLCNVKNILDRDPVSALTGPVERNDIETVRKHLECIKDLNDKEIYISASKKLISLAQKKHPENDYSDMKDLLK